MKYLRLVENQNIYAATTVPSLLSKAVKKFLVISGVKTLFIAPGSPWEKGYFLRLKIWQNQNEYLLLLT